MTVFFRRSRRLDPVGLGLPSVKLDLYVGLVVSLFRSHEVVGGLIKFPLLRFSVLGG